MASTILNWVEYVNLQPPDVDNSAVEFASKISAPLIEFDLSHYKGTHTCWVFAFIQESGTVICYNVPAAQYDYISQLNPDVHIVTTQIVLLVPQGIVNYAGIPIEGFDPANNIHRIPNSFFSR